MADLNGTIARIKYDALDLVSVAAAIREMERAVDAKGAPYHNNALVAPLIAKFKEAFCQAIRKQAAAAKR